MRKFTLLLTLLALIGGCFKAKADTTDTFITIGEKQLGTPTGTTLLAPSRLGYKNSDSENIYAQDIIDLPAGTQIKGITYKGYKYSKTKVLDLSSVEVWLENTTDILPDVASPRSTDKMTKVYSSSLTIPAVTGDESNMVPIYDFTFATPFIYTGSNLRVVVHARGEDNSNVFFEIDANQGNKSIYRGVNTPLGDNIKFAYTTLPVTYLHIDRAVSLLSGIVTAEGSPVADAKVKIVSGTVEYEGTTNNEGKYTIPVYQDDREYTLTVSKEGYFTHIETVVFNGTSMVKNIALERATVFSIMESNIPTTAEVNTTHTATVRIENGEAKEADTYTAQLLVGDIVIAAETPALAQGEEQVFTFAFVPHEAGIFDAFVRFTAPTSETTTETVKITVSEEPNKSEVIVGDANSEHESGPIKTRFKNSRTEIIYPKSLINLPAGTRINTIRFYGYHYANNYQITLNAWMANVAAGTKLQGLTSDGLTQVATNQLIDMGKEIPSSAHAPIIEIAFPDGFIYTGGDIRMLFDASADTWQISYFEIDANVSNQAQIAMSDEPITSKNGTRINLPVARFTITPYYTLSGTVKSYNGAMVEGAYITLTSADNVEYYATTDTEGAFSVQIIKYGQGYTLSVHHPDYNAYTHADAVLLNDGDIDDLTITLKKDIHTDITSHSDDRLHIYGTTGAIIVESPSKVAIRIYNATGLLLRTTEVSEGTTRIGGLPFGIYLVNGVKVIVK